MTLDERKIREETVEEFFRASGPGGQHRNKTETGVRLRHLPTGIVVTATESRSQARNRAVAWNRLLEKLRARAKKRKRRVPTEPTRASRERRLEEKRRRSETKRKRTEPDREEG